MPAGPDRATGELAIDAARKAVLETTELLENIISFLPVTDILTKVQRVSRAWNTLIESSSTIQTRLWRRHRAKRVLQPTRIGGDHTFVPLSRDEQCLYLQDCPIYSEMPEFLPFLNIARCEKDPDDPGWPGLYHLVGDNPSSILFECESFQLGAQEMTKFWRRSGSRKSESAHSWEKMQVANPPIAQAALFVYDPHFLDNYRSVKLILRDDNGITLGHVYDALYAESYPSVEGDDSSEQGLVKDQNGYLEIGFEV